MKPGRPGYVVLIINFIIIFIATACNFPVRQAYPPPTDTVGLPLATEIPATNTSMPMPDPTLTMTPLPTVTATPLPTATPAYTPRVVAYFYGQNRDNQVTDIPVGSVTDILYAFIGISASGKCQLIEPALDKDRLNRLKEIKQQDPELHILISIGGYNGSGRFSDIAADQDARTRFVASCIALMQSFNLDGIDVDWEYPVAGGLAGNSRRPDDKQNFTALMTEFRRQLDRQGQSAGKAYLLSLAAPAGPGEIPHFDLLQLSSLVDWITLMAYDFTTSSSRITNFNAPLYPVLAGPGNPLDNVDSAVQTYLALGVPAVKCVLGVPFYGRAWKGVSSDQNGLYQANSGPFVDPQTPSGTWSDSGEISYRALKQYYLSTWPRFWQDQAQAPWLYQPDKRVWVTYDDPQSLGVKADYARAKRLGGMAIWQISADDKDHSLVNAITTHLIP